MNTSASISTIRLVWRAIQVRLRFVLVLLAASLVVGNWDSVRNRGDALARRFLGIRAGTPDQAVSTDTEYFCPMDPGILSDWPGRCGACNMALVRRKKGEATPRPGGVIARMQFSPYRVQLAGLQTAPVVYRPLRREITGTGNVVDGHLVKVSLFDRDFPMVCVGYAASVIVEGGPSRSGRVSAIIPPTTCEVELDDPKIPFPPRHLATVKIGVPVAALEPFRSHLSGLPPLRKGEPRTLFACPEHPDNLEESPGRCAIDRNRLEARKLSLNQRVEWWCPMHPSVTAEAPGAQCRSCDGMKLVPRIIFYRPVGEVLAVAESAVIDTGTRRIAFIERMPGMFDAVEIVVGPRCGGEYPVVSGLLPGDKVATSGALLIDAETRLDPSLAAGYFGASKRLEAPPVAVAKPVETCPVTGKLLGSMGTPVRVEIDGKSVLICCAGCEAALRRNPAKYLEKPAHRE